MNSQGCVTPEGQNRYRTQAQTISPRVFRSVICVSLSWYFILLWTSYPNIYLTFNYLSYCQKYKKKLYVYY